MRSTMRALTLATAGLFAGAGSLWAHPGHVTHGGPWHTLVHTLSSPYHVAVVVAVVVLAVAWRLTTRPARVRKAQADEVQR